MEQVENFSLTINVDNTTMEKAKILNSGMQGLIKDLGVDRCLAILNNIKKHPTLFQKSLAMMDDPITIKLIKKLLIMKKIIMSLLERATRGDY